MTLRETLLRTIRSRNPGGVLGWFWWDGEAAKYHSEDDLRRTANALPAPLLWHGLQLPPRERLNAKLERDAWGCVWQNEIDGLVGQVVGNPLASYDRLAHYRPPLHLLDVHQDEMVRIRSEIQQVPDSLHRIGWLQLYERMRYLRPAQELYLDIADDAPEVYRLRDVVMAYLHRELDVYVSLGIDVVTFSEDWGTQTSLQIAPTAWKRIFKPAYKELFDRVHKAGGMVEFHSCGFIRDIIDDLIELGVEVVHSQVGCMDLPELSRRFKGRICFEADFDRQQMPQQSPEWVRSEVFRIVEQLGSPAGGLFIVAEVAGATPLENVEAYIAAIRELSPATPCQQSPACDVATHVRWRMGSGY